MGMPSFRDRNPIVLGIASTTVLTLALVGVFMVGKLGLLQDRYTMSGTFAGTGGLHSGNEVRVAGVKVGEVTGVDPDFSRGVVTITWTVDHGVDLGEQTRAEIATANILGGRYLRLSGPVNRPYLAALPATRRRIPESRTRLPVTTNDVIASGAKTLNGLDTTMISNIVDKVSGITPETKAHLIGALQNLAHLADTIQQAGPQLHGLVANTTKLLTMVKSKDTQLVRLAQGIKALLDQLRDRQAELTVLLGSGSHAVGQISQLINNQQQGLVSLMDSLNGTVSGLAPEIDNMNTLLAWLGPSLNAFTTAESFGPFIDAIVTQIGPLSPTDLAKLTGQMGAGR